MHYSHKLTELPVNMLYSEKLGQLSPVCFLLTLADLLVNTCMFLSSLVFHGLHFVSSFGQILNNFPRIWQ